MKFITSIKYYLNGHSNYRPGKLRKNVSQNLVLQLPLFISPEIESRYEYYSVVNDESSNQN